MNSGVQDQNRLSFHAVILDMDGVVTRTADLHAAAWKQLFDEYLGEREVRGLERFEPFDARADYLRYVDGKPRYEGVRSFLASRAITLPLGSDGDPPDADSVHALGARKDAIFERLLADRGAEAYPSTVRLIEALRWRRVAVGVVTASRHGREVLQRTGVEALLDVVIDGNDAARLGLPGKPEPATFLAAAERMGVGAAEAVVVEDAAAGVLAGRRGGFGLVVGVDRGGNREALARSGADVVVGDLAELDMEALDRRFRAERVARETAPVTEDEAWRVEQEGFDPAREHDMESLFTVGNGYLGVRGALDTPLPGSHADLFVAGIYDRKQKERPYSELEFMTEGRDDDVHAELVSLPFPFRVRVSVDGRRFDMVQGPWRSLRRVLDLRRGRVHLSYLFEDEEGLRTTVDTWRAASLHDPHLLLQEVVVTCENHDALVEIDGSLNDPDIAANHPHLTPLPERREIGVEVRAYRTQASGYVVAIASRGRMAGRTEDALYLQAHGEAGKAVRWRRCAFVHTNRGEGDPIERALADVQSFEWDGFGAAQGREDACWEAHWRVADIEVGGSAPTTQALRFNAYHLRIAADDNPETSIGARTLSGRAYEGHIFWDVEIFMLPYFVHSFPDIARSLLMYRHHTLDGARRRAVELGFRGACYAWESTVTGADTTPRSILLKSSGKEIPIYTGYEQVHVTADVAYGVCRYLEASGDPDFLAEAGAEILFETARFWVSRSERGEGAYHINGVTGPDEYHHTVDDNAYTNWMARFNLEKAVWAAEELARSRPQAWEALRRSLELDADELDVWDEVARGLYCPGPRDGEVIEQFRGYFGLQDYRVPEAERFRPPLRRLFEAEEVNGSQLIKQADVLMLAYLFPERFSRSALEANYDYYEPRTDHGSSLSPPVHAALAARLGRYEDALEYWRRSLWLDLSNTMGNSALGVHAACMAGTWQTLVFGFLGVEFSEHGPAATSDAWLPPTWRSVELALRYRGELHRIRHVAPDPREEKS